MPEVGIRELQWKDREELCSVAGVSYATGAKRHHSGPPQQCQVGVLVERVAEDWTSHDDSKDRNQVLHYNSYGERTKPKAAYVDRLWRCRG